MSSVQFRIVKYSQRARPSSTIPYPVVLALAVHSALCVPRLFFPNKKDAKKTKDRSDENSKYKPVIGVTVGWLLLHFAFLFRQSMTAFSLFNWNKAYGTTKIGLEAIKYGRSGGKVMLEANRTVGNMVEQSAPFLVALWAHARFLDPIRAAKLGWVWLAFRALYPKVWGKVPSLFFSTFPG